MKKLLAGISFIAIISIGYAQPLIPHTIAFPTGTIWFYSYTPPHYSTTPGLLPLIIALHGAGEHGESPTDLPALKTLGLPMLIDKGATMEFNWHNKKEGFVVLAPQATISEVGYWPVRYVNEMINYGIANLRVDPKRIFVTGYSFGANGTWNYGQSAGSDLSKVTGLVPAATFSTALSFCNITNNKVAVWAFQGKLDDSYKVTGPVNQINDPAQCPQIANKFIPAVDTLYPNEGHDIYDRLAYDTSNNTHYPNMYQWMLSINRDMDPTTNENPVPIIAGAPTINLTTPVKMRDFPLLDASASHDDDVIMDYLWEQTQGPDNLLPADNTTEKIRQYPVTKILPAANSGVGVAQGSYKFRVRVKDYLTYLPGHTQFANLTINVQLPLSGHSAPAVDAGDDHVLDPAEPVWLMQGAYKYYGSSFSGTPFNWRFLSGPAVAAVYDYNGAGPYVGPGLDKNVRFVNMNVPGQYFFEFSATNDYGEIGRDTVVMTRLGALVLPVSYEFFNGQRIAGANLLSWATSAEINSARFDVLRSTDGTTFNTIGSVGSRGGQGTTQYSFEDNNPPYGVSYYRLSQVDKDGHSALSKTITINNRKTGLYVEQYPNPVHDNLTVTVQGSSNGTLQVVIADMQGKTLVRQQWQKDLSVLKKTINVGALQQGVYQMIVTVGQEKQVSSFVKY